MLMGLMVRTAEYGGGDQRELERLLAGIAGGEHEDLAQLYHRTRAAVYALALSYLKNAHDAQDVTQDTYVRVWENAGQYRAQGSPMAWLLTIARNLSRMKLRQGARQGELSEEEWNAIPADSPDVTPEDPLRQEILALAAEKGTQVLLLEDGAEISFGEAELTLYPPLGSGDANEAGLSVLCSAGDFDALITGDMGDDIERRLVKYGDLPDIELLVAGHHGSKHATSEELLLETKPELAVISVGYNSYGHPAPETLERLAAAGCAIYRTDWHGAVTVTAP